eukprot:9243905-Pyramimonas_sp.AAC.1
MASSSAGPGDSIAPLRGISPNPATRILTGRKFWGLAAFGVPLPSASLGVGSRYTEWPIYHVLEPPTMCAAGAYEQEKRFVLLYQRKPLAIWCRHSCGLGCRTCHFVGYRVAVGEGGRDFILTNV